MRPSAAIAATLVWVPWLGGCVDADIEPQNIIDNRVIAARLEVASEPERAWPLPGEAATLTWLVADPTDPRPLGWHFDVCVAVPSMRDVPRCAAPPFARTTQATAALGVPLVAFDVPDAAALGGAAELAVLGVICADGSPALRQAWPAWGCHGAGSEPTLVSFEVALQQGSETNHNPSLADDRVLLDGAEWAAPRDPSPPTWGCESEPHSSALPHVPGNEGEHRVTVVFAGDDRELLSTESSLSPGRETLYVSHLATDGVLEHYFDVVEATDASPTPETHVSWTAPTQGDPTGKRVRFYVVVRDGRGGADWTMREVCVVP